MYLSYYNKNIIDYTPVVSVIFYILRYSAVQNAFAPPCNFFPLFKLMYLGRITRATY